MNKNALSALPKRGFTLIELLAVIAIIGILSAILIPTIGVVRKSASKTTSASNLRQIALGYSAFSTAGSRIRSIKSGDWVAGSALAANSSEWAQVLADLGELNDAALYFIESAKDVALLDSIPQTILDDANTQTDTWSAASNAISYDAATQISPNARSAITPLIWTKGIAGNSSTWSPTSPWQGEGGHIAFLDGHVVFYKELTGELSDPSGDAKDNLNDALGIGGDANDPIIVSAPSD